MRVGISGATGYVGRHVVEELLRGGHNVVALSRRHGAGQAFSWGKQVEWFPYSIGDSSSGLFGLMGFPDRFIHLAWEGLPNYRESFHLERNLPNDIRFISGLLDDGLKDISVAGTCFEFGMKSGPLEDDAETDPILPYSIAKDAVRRWLASVSKRREVSWKWLRIFYSYGEGQAKTSLIEQFQQAVLSGARTFPMSGGEQLRDYQPVSDLAQQIALASLQTDIQGPINCCSGSPTSVRRLVEQFRGQLSTEIELELGRYPYPDYEPMAYWGLRRKLDSIFASRRT